MIPTLRRVIPFLSLLLLPLLAHAQPSDEHAKVSAFLNHSAVTSGQEVVVAVVLDVGKGFHAQSANPNNLLPLKLTVDSNPNVRFAPPILPPGHNETYPDIGTTNVYTGRTIFYIPAKVDPAAKPGPLTIPGRIRYQICDDKGVCFAPETVQWKVETKVVATGEPTPANAPEIFKDYKAPAELTYATAAPPPGPVTTRSTALPPTARSVGGTGTGAGGASSLRAGPPPIDLADDKPTYTFGAALGIAFLVGIIFNVMPCVLPVLPLKAMGFYEVAQHHRGKTILLALAFSLGIIAVFAGLSLLI